MSIVLHASSYAALRDEHANPADLAPETAIMYFGNDWFAENRTSSHQLARQLAYDRRRRRSNDLLFHASEYHAPRAASKRARTPSAPVDSIRRCLG